MKLSVSVVCLLLALICFVLKGLSVPTGRVDLMNIGFAFVVASVLFG